MPAGEGSERLTEICNLMYECLQKTHAVTCKYLQSSLGKFSFVSSCVNPGRFFVQRLLSFLRSFYIKPELRFELPYNTNCGLKCWNACFPLHNGVSIMFVEKWSLQSDELLA